MTNPDPFKNGHDFRPYHKASGIPGALDVPQPWRCSRCGCSIGSPASTYSCDGGRLTQAEKQAVNRALLKQIAEAR